MEALVVHPASEYIHITNPDATTIPFLFPAVDATGAYTLVSCLKRGLFANMDRECDAVCLCIWIASAMWLLAVFKIIALAVVFVCSSGVASAITHSVCTLIFRWVCR